MQGFPAYCPNCGAAFVARNIIGGPGAATVVMKGGTTNCPACGGIAHFADGEYRYSEAVVDLLNGPQITRDLIEQLRDVAARARSREITPEEAIDAAQHLSPELGELLKRFVLYGLPLLIAILTAYLQYQDGISSSEQNKAILEAIERQTIAILAEQSESEDDTKAKSKSPKQRIKTEGARNAPKSRRSQVRAAQRAALKLRRQQFPRQRR